MTEQIGIIILAAGASRRMGQPKQLLRFNGKSLIQHICQLALKTACRPIVVVLGANASIIQDELEKVEVDIVFNQEWGKGMGTSLSQGITQLLKKAPDTQAAIFLLVDQPMVSLKLIDQLIQSYKKGTHLIIASQYGSTLGVPALIDQQYFMELKHIEADRGARFLIQKERAHVKAIPFPDGANDIDQPEDWEQFLKGLQVE